MLSTSAMRERQVHTTEAPVQPPPQLMSQRDPGMPAQADTLAVWLLRAVWQVLKCQTWGLTQQCPSQVCAPENEHLCPHKNTTRCLQQFTTCPTAEQPQRQVQMGGHKMWPVHSTDVTQPSTGATCWHSLQQTSLRDLRSDRHRRA